MTDVTLPAAEDSAATQATHLVKRLRQAIMTGELAPGAKLRLEALRSQLALTISRSPLREALSRLGAEGLVLIEDGRGYRVTPVSGRNLRELTLLRLHGESLALREAVARGDDAWRARLRAAAEHLLALEADGAQALQADWEQADRALHDRLLGVCALPLLLAHCTTLHDLYDRYRCLFLANRDTPLDFTRERQGLVDAACDGDADLAVALHGRMIRRASEAIEQRLRSIPSLRES